MPRSPSVLESLLGAALFAALFAGSAACGDLVPTDNGDQGGPALDLGPPPDFGPPEDLGDVGDQGDPGGPFVTAHVQFVESRPSVGTVTVDASGTEPWIYVDLDRRTEVSPANPLDDDVWDLAFRRFHVALNGGASGTAGVTAAVVDDRAFDTVEAADATAFVSDATDGDDEDTVPDYVISGGNDPWYAYDVTTHVLTPKPRVFVVRTTDGNLVKVAIERYYDGAGGSGHPTLRYERIEE